jgi:hypothetical protein
MWNDGICVGLYDWHHPIYDFVCAGRPIVTMFCHLWPSYSSGPVAGLIFAVHFYICVVWQLCIVVRASGLVCACIVMFWHVWFAFHVAVVNLPGYIEERIYRILKYFTFNDRWLWKRLWIICSMFLSVALWRLSPQIRNPTTCMHRIRNWKLILKRSIKLSLIRGIQLHSSVW